MEFNAQVTPNFPTALTFLHQPSRESASEYFFSFFSLFTSSPESRESASEIVRCAHDGSIRGRRKNQEVAELPWLFSSY